MNLILKLILGLALGALIGHITGGHLDAGKGSFQPMNINYGLLPPMEAPRLDEAGRVRGTQTGGRPDGAVDIRDRAAGAADQVMVVVAHPQLEQRRCAGGLDATGQAAGDQRPEDAVDGLG